MELELLSGKQTNYIHRLSHLATLEASRYREGNGKRLTDHRMIYSYKITWADESWNIILFLVRTGIFLLTTLRI